MDGNPNDLKAIANDQARPSLVGRAFAAGGSSGRRLGRALTPRLAPVRSFAPLPFMARHRIALPARTIALIIPALILASGIVTAISAQLLADGHARAVAALAPRTAPLIAAERAANARADALAALRPLLEDATVSAQIEGLARDLPADVRIATLGRDGLGRISLGLLTADPDRLRGITPLAGFRQLDQRRDPSGRMLVLYQAGAR